MAENCLFSSANISDGAEWRGLEIAQKYSVRMQNHCVKRRTANSCEHLNLSYILGKNLPFFVQNVPYYPKGLRWNKDYFMKEVTHFDA